MHGREASREDLFLPAVASGWDPEADDEPRTDQEMEDVFEAAEIEPQKDDDNPGRKMTEEQGNEARRKKG
jgi:hypothetical protein